MHDLLTALVSAYSALGIAVWIYCIVVSSNVWRRADFEIGMFGVIILLWPISLHIYVRIAKEHWRRRV